MRIDIRTHGLTLDPETQALVHLRLICALGRMVRYVGRVGVYLADENGPRGGVDKTCRLVVGMPGGRSAVIEDRADDLRAAVCRAADRAGEAVRRDADRAHRHRHRARVRTAPVLPN